MSLTAKETAFRRRMLEARLTVGTQEVYTRAIAELRKAGFTPTYSGLLGYFASVEGSIATGPSRSVGQLRTMKCAAMYFSKLSPETAISSQQSKDLDEVLQGITTLQAASRTEPYRGALDQDQLSQLVDLAHSRNLRDIGDGFVVMHGVACRPRDVAEICAERVNLPLRLVAVRAKRRLYLRALKGEWEDHPIRSEGAMILLARSCRALPKGPLFPAWKTTTASRLVKEAAKIYAWPSSVKWDGAHCIRHGTAGDEMRRALAQVQERGAWAAPASAAHYARSNNARTVAKRAKKD